MKPWFKKTSEVSKASWCCVLSRGLHPHIQAKQTQKGYTRKDHN